MMQLRSFGRLRVTRRIEGLGKDTRMCSFAGGGGVAKFEGDIVEDELEDLIREEDWKTRTGQTVRESL